MKPASRPSSDPKTPRSAEPDPAAPASADADALEVLAVLDAPGKPPASPPAMDADFIERNQIIERYLSGKLPVRGAVQFERYCRAHPELLDAIGLPDHVHAALKLLDASGGPQPWEPPPKRFWEKPWLPSGLGLAVIVLLAVAISFGRGRDAERRRLAALDARIAEQPLDPPTETRIIRLLPSPGGALNSPAVALGADGRTQLDELLLDLSRSPFHEYRVTMDRIGQGRVEIIDGLAKDSNGHLHLTLNSSALGPGDYRLTIEGINWRGRAAPDSWVTIEIEHGNRGRVRR